VVVTTRAKQKQGKSRTDLIGRNLKILCSVIDGTQLFRGDAMPLLVANSVGVLTYFAQKFSRLPWGQVIWLGTFLDSALDGKDPR
jgi:L-lactate dehydrogenase